MDGQLPLPLSTQRVPPEKNLFLITITVFSMTGVRLIPPLSSMERTDD